jgi:MFS family permease
MATELKPQPTITSLVAGIACEAQKLLSEHVALFRREVQTDLMKAKQATVMLAAGAGLAGLGGIFIFLAIVYLLAWLFPPVPLWVWYFVVGGGLALLGVIFCFTGLQRFKSCEVLPQRSIAALKEDIQWIKTST